MQTQSRLPVSSVACPPLCDKADKSVSELNLPFRHRAAPFPCTPTAPIGSTDMFLVYLAAFSLLAGAAATNQSFTSSGEMDFTMCPITYFGQRYEKAYVSFSSNRFAVCFKGSYIPGISNDCILMSGGTADRGELMVLVKEIPTGSGVHQLLPNLQHPGKCVNVIPLKDSQLSEIHQVELANFDMQSLVAIRTFSGYTNVSLVADALVNGRIVSNHIFQTNETNKGVITDVSGCRFAGLVYQTNTTVYEPSICSMVTCEASGVATAVSNCGSMERCQGNGSCALNAVCSVAGSMIIDFMGGHQSVPDRCGYTLLRSPALPGVQVVGVFKERRRKSVSFLDRVILQLEGEGVEISLEQGNRVQLDDTLLTLNATAQLVHGMELSKDLNGVTAKIMDSNYNISVSFDGFTAIIHMAGPIGAAMHGLCADSSAILSQERVSQHSATDCETQYEDANGTTDCNTTAEWCNLLREAPFTTCNSHVDPKPFIDGCTQQLCKYPSEDNVKCQFLDAYAQTCRQYSDVTVDGWRSQTGCSAVPPAICRDKFCSDHEFCGVDSITGATRCLCRAIFASKYKPTNSFGEPIVCEKKSASVTLANCLLNDEGIDYSILTLNDPTCRGEMDNLTHMVKFSFNSENTCGTVIMANSTHINYKNTIMTQNTSDEIIRHDKLHMDFSCYYTQPDIKSFALKLRHSSVIQQISSGEWKYNLTMEAYTNPDRIKPVDSNTNIALNEKLWVDIMADGLDETILTIVTDSCWATSQPSPTATLRYYVIIDGCPNLDDGTVKVEGNGMGLSNRFSFNAFQFSGRDSEVYLHCKVELCLKQENCIKSCSQARRRRRSASTTYLDKNTAFITMAWTY